MESGLPLLLVSVDTSPLYCWSEGERARPGCALYPVAPGLQEAAANGFDELMLPDHKQLSREKAY